MYRVRVEPLGHRFFRRDVARVPHGGTPVNLRFYLRLSLLFLLDFQNSEQRRIECVAMPTAQNVSRQRRTRTTESSHSQIANERNRRTVASEKSCGAARPCRHTSREKRHGGYIFQVFLTNRVESSGPGPINERWNYPQCPRP